MLDPPSEILLEMFEPKNVGVDEAAVEPFLDQDFQVAHAKHCNGALPADPDIALCLWPHLDECVAKEPACCCLIEFSLDGDHSEGFAHARPNEFLGPRVQDDVVERLGVAIKHRYHDAVTGGGDPIPKDRIDCTARKSQQTCQGPIGGFLPPLTEQVKNEKQPRRLCPCTPVEGKEMFYLLDEHRHHVDTLVI